MSALQRFLIGASAAAIATAALFALGIVSNYFDRRRNRRARAARDPFWGLFWHAYGVASDLPALFARLTPEFSEVWSDLSERLCHQGDARTTAGVAAVPVLVDYAASLPPQGRPWIPTQG